MLTVHKIMGNVCQINWNDGQQKWSTMYAFLFQLVSLSHSWGSVCKVVWNRAGEAVVKRDYMDPETLVLAH